MARCELMMGICGEEAPPTDIRTPKLVVIPLQLGPTTNIWPQAHTSCPPATATVTATTTTSCPTYYRQFLSPKKDKPKMAPKQRTPETTTSTTSSPTPSRSSKASANNTSASAIAQGIWDKYVTKTPQQTKLLDTFLGFLVVVAALQFAYVVLVGNFVRSAQFIPSFSHTISLSNRIASPLSLYKKSIGYSS